MLEIESTAVPLLVSLINSAGLDVLIGCGLNVTAVRESETSGTPTPVPVSGTECGLPAAFDTTLTAAVFAPRLVGLNATTKTQLATGVRLAPQPLLTHMNSVASGPVSVMLVMSRVIAPLLVSCISCPLLGHPTV
jgi:hypothetical protein